ncbi:peroxin [Trifolium repens]|nr:peroxin [Trifolium repens]
MDFLLHPPSVLYSLYTGRRFHTLQNKLVLELLLEALSLLTMSMLRVIMVWQSTSALTRLKEKLGRFWLHMIQRWPTVKVLNQRLRGNGMECGPYEFHHLMLFIFFFFFFVL